MPKQTALGPSGRLLRVPYFRRPRLRRRGQALSQNQEGGFWELC